MGVAFPCPYADFDDLKSRLDAVLMKAISFNGENVRSALRSVSFNGRDSEPILRSFRARKLLSLSFKGRESNTTVSFNSPPSEMEEYPRPVSFKSGDTGRQLIRSNSSFEVRSCIRLGEPINERHQAALKLQKVYKSFRTRRRLADCAVVVEQRWWKLLDFAELKRSSISFFDIEKPETAFSRWSRARKRAAKVGQGLSKDEKARKLALQHWLEAIDPRHRYGHNLQFYYVKWLHCQSRQPFFYWLDIGEGKEVNLDRCPRSKLQQQCIKYLGPTERQEYEVVLENGKFVHKQSGKILDTRGGPEDAKWIFVLSASKTLYVGMKKKGKFQHSSFLAGGATLSAGRLVVEDGLLKAIWPHSGHYLPTEENFQEFMSFLREHNVDLSDVKKSPNEEGEEVVPKETTPPKLTKATGITSVPRRSSEQDSDAADNNDLLASGSSHGFAVKIVKPELETFNDAFEDEAVEPSNIDELPKLPNEDGYESAEDLVLTEEDFMFLKMNLFDEDEGDEDGEPIPQEKIIRRINSHKEMRSYQLARQLCCKWTTGAGPRIGCMRDYPSELQFRVLEDANLSPRSNSTPRTVSRSDSTPTSASREISSTATLPLGDGFWQTATP